MQFVIEIPDAQAERLIPSGEDPSRATLEALALEGYRSGRLFGSDLRRMLGFDTSLEVHAFLDDHGVDLNYTVEEWQKDKRTADINVQELEASALSAQ